MDASAVSRYVPWPPTLHLCALVQNVAHLMDLRSCACCCCGNSYDGALNTCSSNRHAVTRLPICLLIVRNRDFCSLGRFPASASTPFGYFAQALEFSCLSAPLPPRISHLLLCVRLCLASIIGGKLNPSTLVEHKGKDHPTAIWSPVNQHVRREACVFMGYLTGTAWMSRASSPKSKLAISASAPRDL